MSRRLLVATGSQHKLDELRELLELPATELVSLADLGLAGDAPEDGETFEENARFKALWYARLSGLPTLADDSGLEVDHLDGRPGVRTRRFAGEDATDDQNNMHLLRLLAGVPPEQRGARYRCVLAFVGPDDVVEVSDGSLEGRIALEPRGAGGFGYDPIFEPADEPIGGRTVGQLTPAQKNAISHRAEAARAMGRLLRDRGY
ncbi:MAG TPA: RdgB/HAM1 family non-canonical purine NTP pyrophosphatase [Candidatus Limnocylindrales bacterium]|nr:RdgB/HAM1 family non-canonical purine NTP pyrophosphatase [Candidatus Limnocylindrales bacterium]